VLPANPRPQEYRTFTMVVRGRRKPPIEEITGGMGAGITLWDGSDGVEPIRVAPHYENNEFTGWEVSVIAKVDAPPGRGVIQTRVPKTPGDERNVSLGEAKDALALPGDQLPERGLRPDSVIVDEVSTERWRAAVPPEYEDDLEPIVPGKPWPETRITLEGERRLAPAGVDPNDPSTWPEGYTVRWERVRMSSLTPSERAEYEQAADALMEGFIEGSDYGGKVLGELPIRTIMGSGSGPRLEAGEKPKLTEGDA
jgi:hypothetical protein